ncbi:trypsin-like serine peptidase [Roseivivax sp. CAU 1761]
MRRVLAPLLLLLALAPPPPAVSEEVGTAALLPAVGRLNIAGYRSRGMCTATLVAPALVLTAAHCVLDRDGTPKPRADMVFVAGWTGRGHAGASRIRALRPHPRAIGADGIDVAHDLALLDLAVPLAVTPLDLGAASPAGPFALAGYARARPHRLALTEECGGTAGRRGSGRVWRLDCPVDYGQSGGPALFGATRKVAAVISAREGAASLAVPVDAWVRAEIARPYTPPGD